jgi:predicted nucleic acid-binding protein
MYLIGAPHPHKDDAKLLLENVVLSGQHLVTDAEVLQEILHRYAAIGKREAIQPAFEVVRNIVDEVFAIEERDVLRAGDIMEDQVSMSARDAIHIAVMERHGIETILSFDADFDRWPGVKRMFRLRSDSA